MAGGLNSTETGRAFRVAGRTQITVRIGVEPGRARLVAPAAVLEEETVCARLALVVVRPRARRTTRRAVQTGRVRVVRVCACRANALADTAVVQEVTCWTFQARACTAGTLCAHTVTRLAHLLCLYY